MNTFSNTLTDTQFCVDRRDSSQRPAHEAETDDIMGMLELLDGKGRLQSVTFAAADLSRVPNYSP